MQKTEIYITCAGAAESTLKKAQGVKKFSPASQQVMGGQP